MTFFQRINSFFSGQYANHVAIGNNLLLLLMYKFAYPFAAKLSEAGFSPNQITTMSIILSVAAALSLITDDGWTLFLMFWSGALLLDFCDGTVARKTNTVRKTAFRYDHTSDLIKIFLIILAVGIRYNEQLIWIFSLGASFSFMFFMVVNHDLSTAKSRFFQSEQTTMHNVEIQTNGQSSNIRKPLRIRSKILKAIYAAVMTINGHTLLVFFVFPFGGHWALLGLSYLVTISLFRSAVCVYMLNMIPK